MYYPYISHDLDKNWSLNLSEIYRIIFGLFLKLIQTAKDLGKQDSGAVNKFRIECVD